MSTSPKGAATFFKTWKSTFVGHLGLQSMSYRVGTPCIAELGDKELFGHPKIVP